jgi:hypothetical protein
MTNPLSPIVHSVHKDSSCWMGRLRNGHYSVPQFLVYATSRTHIVPSVSRRTVKGNSAVVTIGVDRGGVGRDNGARWRVSGIARRTKFLGAFGKLLLPILGCAARVCSTSL